MKDFTPGAKAVRTFLARSTPEPNFAYLSGALVNPRNGLIGAMINEAGILVGPTGAPMIPTGVLPTPEDYGAVGDGIADDSGHIQDAVNASSFVFFGNKTYRMGSSVTLNQGNCLLGSGIQGTIILLDDGVSGFVTTQNFTSVRFMTIQGTNPSHLAGNGVALGNSGGATGNTCNLESVEFLFCAIGLYNGFYDGVSVRNCVFHGNTNNIKCEANVAPMQLTDCVVNDATSDGIVLVNGGNVLMTGGNMNSNGLGGSASAVYLESDGCVFVGNKIQFEGVGNNVPGSIYINAAFNCGISLSHCQFQDGNVVYKHVACSGGTVVTADRNIMYNSPNGGPWLFGGGTFRAISEDSSLLVRYNGIYSYRAGPYQIYNSNDVLPTASDTSENQYGVITESGGTETALHWFIKKQAASSFSYVQLDP